MCFGVSGVGLDAKGLITKRKLGWGAEVCRQVSMPWTKNRTSVWQMISYPENSI